MTSVTTVAEALHALGFAANEPPSRPVALRGSAGTLVPIARLDAELRPEWWALWLEEGSPPRFLGPPIPEGLEAQRGKLTGPTARLIDLMEAAILSLIERLEEADQGLQRLEGLPAPEERAGIPSGRRRTSELKSVSQTLVTVRRHVGRVVSITAELDGPLGASFPDLGRLLPALQGKANRLQNLALTLQGSFRDILLTQSAEESNRISEVANQLGATSNRISAIANASNIRMLGLAYLALLLALIAAALLIPETAATILSMPSATWVPGTWVTLVLVLTTGVPLAVIFTRPWVVAILKGLGSIERRSGEGVQDLPETDARGTDALPLSPPVKRS